MRVTFSAIYRNGVDDIARASEALVRHQRNAASGRRVHTPSDDPSASATIVGERAEIRALDQYVRATESVDSRLRVIDTALSDILKMLTAAQTSVAAASNSFVTQEQRDAYAGNLAGLRDAILGDLNTKYRGEQLFAGTATTTVPYVKDAAGQVQAYAGNDATIEIDIDRNRAVEVTIAGDRIVKGGETQGLFEVFEAAIAAVKAGDLGGMSQALDGLTRAFDRVTAAQTRVGTGLGQLDDHRMRLDEMRRASEARRSTLQDANLAESITAMQQADSARQAAIGVAAGTSKLSLFDFLK